MDSPLVRGIVATLGGYLLILILLSVYEWVLEEYPSRPPEPIKSERIQHKLAHQDAIKALKLFSRLPNHEKASIKKGLKSNLISINQWLNRLKQSDYQILCMGELHEESTRSFLSQVIFPNFSADVLLLESTQDDLESIDSRLEVGRDYFPLLGADIMNILRTVRDRNPNIKIYGIEQTDKQAMSHNGRVNPRDQSISQNFWATFEPELRHIILFGALHCTNESNWLFYNLSRKASPTLKEEMLNVLVLGEHQKGPVEAFVYFIDEIGFEKRHYVIPDTSTLPDQIYEWFPLLNRQILKKYRSLIIFST